MAFADDVKKYVDKGIEVSKEALSKAGSAVTKFGDQSVKKVEKLQLESKLKQQLNALGEAVYTAFTTDGAEMVSVQTLQPLVAAITTTKHEIAAREEALKNLQKGAKNASEAVDTNGAQ